MTFSKYIINSTIYANDMKNQYSHRMGQSHFNYLDQVKPEFAKYIRGTKFDPFFDDNRISEFFKLILTVWDENENKENEDSPTETAQSSV
jgi:hypothetical protein